MDQVILKSPNIFQYYGNIQYNMDKYSCIRIQGSVSLAQDGVFMALVYIQNKWTNNVWCVMRLFTVKLYLTFEDDWSVYL